MGGPQLRYRHQEIIDVLGDVDLVQPATSLDTSAPITHGLDEPTRIDLARKWLKRQAPALDGQGGNRRTYDVACAVARGHDLTEDEALTAMRDWNQMCQPPWSDDDLRDVIRHAIRYAKGPAGTKLWVRDAKGKFIPNNQRNVRIAFDELGLTLRLNEFAARIEVSRNGRTLTLDDATRDDIWLQIDERFKMRPSQDFFGKMLRGSLATTAITRSDYLTGLLWTATANDTWLVDYAGAADDAYTRPSADCSWWREQLVPYDPAASSTNCSCCRVHKAMTSPQPFAHCAPMPIGSPTTCR